MALMDDHDLASPRGFEITRRGYDRVQVDEHLARLEASLGALKTDRDAAVSQASDLRERVRHLDVQVKRLSLPPTTLEGLSERLQNMLQLAQDEANETKEQAAAEAAKIREQVEAEAAKLKTGYEQLITEVEARREALEAKRDGILGKAKAEAEAILKRAEDARNRAEAEMVATHEKADADFKATLATRDAEAMRVIAERESSSNAEAERRIREATENANRTLEEKTTEANRRLYEATNEANRRVAEATQESMRRVSYAAERVRELRRLRQQISGQMHTLQSELTMMQSALDSVHSAFSEAGPLLEQGDEEQEILTRPALPTNQLPLALPQIQVDSVPEQQAEQAQRADQELHDPAAPYADPPTRQIGERSDETEQDPDGN